MCEQVVRDLRKFGINGTVNLRSDQDVAIRDLLKGICQLRGSARSVEECSPVGDSKANGFAERAVQAMEEMVRVQKLGIENRIEDKLTVKHRLFPWLVEHCADLLNRYQVGAHGRTAYQRLMQWLQHVLPSRPSRI